MIGRTAVACALLAVGAAGAQSAFPHKYHVEEEGLACTDCHAAAPSSRASADALLPESAVCRDCHEEGAVTMSPPAAVRDLEFDHAHHVADLGIDCETCHRGLREERVRAAGYLPAMDQCMTCHNGGAAPRDCESCHRVDRAALRPASHGAGWKAEHGPLARIADASCVPCHAVSDCQECHDGALLVEQASLGAARQIPFTPQAEGSAGLVVQRVHGLQFRFLHGIEARGKGTECLTCHELDSGDFCAECHNPAGDAGVRPAWHGGSGWTTLGRGSGGGRHAELARRDLEACAACHEPRGDDPVCLQCHIDRTFGKGNDPATHASTFADDIGDGDFHDDDGALCFTCHTRQEVTDGFCTYCHELRPK